MKSLPTVLCSAVVAAFFAAPAPAADLEHRTYVVTVDGKPAGEMKMTMQSLDDGTQLMAGQAALTVKRGNDPFRTSYRGLETWKGGRLQKYEAFSDDDEKKRHLVGGVQDAKFRVTVNGQRHDVRPDVWTTSFWFAPAVPKKVVDVALFDVDSGKEAAARLEYVGAETRTVMGTSLECGHYRLRGQTIQADLWYDGADRLLRSEVTTSPAAGAPGSPRKTVLDLTKVQK